eukprot:ANDGO_07649.mRNA.1 putative histone-binding protein Caf1
MEDAELENKNINEEYRIWKKNTPFLYDFVMTHALTWPSLTCSWLPTRTCPPDRDYVLQELLLGTHTSGSEQNFLIVASVRLPKSMTAEVDPSKYQEDKQEFGGYGNDLSKLEIKQIIPHDGEVNRARSMPSNPHMLASKTPSGEVHVFDKSKHPSNLEYAAQAQQGKTWKSNPQLRLKGHSKEGYGIDWNPHVSKSSYIVSGSDDNLVCVWDIDNNTGGEPLHRVQYHTANVEDVQWHRIHDDLFGSCSDDHRFCIWDIRNKASRPQFEVVVSNAEVNCIAFSPYNEYLAVCGSADRGLRVFDLRHFREPLHVIEGVHRDQVLGVQWSPNAESVFASSGADRRVMIWDLRLTGSEQTAEDAEDGPAELLFVHGGHTSRVVDFAWNPSPGGEWMLASTAEDNVVQIWQMAENIYQDTDEAILDVKQKEIGE